MLKTGTAYNLVAESLRAQIIGGDLQPGQQLPTEFELCERFTTSRITIRRALQILEEERLVQRRQGSGTFVSPAPTRKIPLLNVGFFSSVRRHAPDMTRRLLHQRWSVCDPEQAAQLETVPGDRVLLASRVDLLGRKAVAIDDVCLPRRFADQLTAADLAQLDFLAAWQRVQRISLSHCKQILEAAAASAQVARCLGIPKGAAVLRESNIMYLGTGHVAGIFLSHYRADYFQFSGTVKIGGSEAVPT